jgi:hypothetical protein
VALHDITHDIICSAYGGIKSDGQLAEGLAEGLPRDGVEVEKNFP